MFYTIVNFYEASDDNQKTYFGRMNGLHVYKAESYEGVLIILHNKSRNIFVAGIKFYKYRSNPKILQVSMVGVEESYRGQNIPAKLYAWLITTQKMIIMSDTLQTAGGKAIWESLARDKRIYMMGYNTHTRECINIDQNDLFNEDIYQEELKAELKELMAENTELGEFPDSNTPIKMRNAFRAKHLKLWKKIAAVEKAIDSTRDIVLVAMKNTNMSGHTSK